MIVQDTQFLLNFVEGLVDKCDYGKVIDAVFRVTAERLQFARMNIILFDDKKGLWRRIARRDFSGDSIKAKCDQGPITDPIRELAEHHHWDAQVIGNYYSCPEAEFLPNFIEEGLRSGIHAYLHHNGKCLGVFSVQNSEPDFYCENDAIFIYEVGQVVAAALESIGDYHEAVTKKKLNVAKTQTPRLISPDDGYEDIIGFSQVMRQLKKMIDRVASTDTTVLIHGETGTGKELVANAIHKRSSRVEERLVTVNCAALATELVSSELFGHVAGAFTGATSTYKGRFEVADKGTLFLDEIGDIPPETQTRLLRVLEEGKLERVGSTESISTNVRIIAATHRDLKEMVERGEFRADLLFRLNVFPIYVPPLRDRDEDIVDLAIHFANLSASRINKPVPIIDDQTMEILKKYRWVGNVRELRNVIERAVILCDKTRIKPNMLPMDVAYGCRPSALGIPNGMDRPGVMPDVAGSQNESPNGQLSSLPSLEEVIRTHIIKALNRCNGKISGRGGAARILDLNPKTLESKMRKLGIQRHWR